MASMRHPNIVAFMGVCSTPPSIVTEFCELGSLTAMLQAGKAMPETAASLTWRVRLKMVSGGGGAERVFAFASRTCSPLGLPECVQRRHLTDGCQAVGVRMPLLPIYERLRAAHA
jgi:hypothetical protein